MADISLRYAPFTDLELVEMQGALAYSIEMGLAAAELLYDEIQAERDRRELGIAGAMTAPIYYFGCGRDVGHYFYEPGKPSSTSRNIVAVLPESWQKVYDAGLPPDKRRGQTEGHAKLHHEQGWTALSFWDRSVDSRGNSHSTFFVRANLDFMPMLNLCAVKFPEVFERIKFDVVDKTGG